MLNISKHRIHSKIDKSKYTSMKIFMDNRHYKIIRNIIWLVFIAMILFLFLPWTQNVEAPGFVTALDPSQRPQTVHSSIDGRIEKWFVQEGEYVNQGDTIMYISEITSEYLDPNLINNTQSQLEAKEQSVYSYSSKVIAMQNQIEAIKNEKTLKLKQTQNKIKQNQLKVESDSIELEAVKTQLNIAENQYNRAFKLNEEGLKPMTYVEEKKVKLQQMQAKMITQENKYIASQNELINSEIEISRIISTYAEKLAKANSDLQSAISTNLATKADVSKLQSTLSNYLMRRGMYYITAPQSGYINRALQSGIGETIKKGASIVSIMPQEFKFAVEAYIIPMEYPLIKKGHKIRISFDGWPTIVFSGWPGISYGTFGGIVVAKENFISPNGMYRILIAPDPEEQEWPSLLGIGAGAQTLALLETVPIWKEIWRTLNGFPPNFYQVPENTDPSKK